MAYAFKGFKSPFFFFTINNDLRECHQLDKVSRTLNFYLIGFFEFLQYIK